MNIESGENLYAVCKRAIDVARETGQEQYFHFNDTPLIARPNGSPEALALEWQSKRETGQRDREDARRNREALERILEILKLWGAGAGHLDREVSVRALDAISLIIDGDITRAGLRMVTKAIARALGPTNEQPPGSQAPAGGQTKE
jgi:hypothetical protein